MRTAFFRNAAFILNRLTLAFGFGEFGAIRFNGVGSLTNVDFVGNRAKTGVAGAVVVSNLANLANLGDVVIEESRFEGNEALLSHGGGIFVDFSGLLAVERSTFVENEAAKGGGISNTGKSEVSESTCFSLEAIGPSLGFNKRGVVRPQGAAIAVALTIR